ncbi:Hypothetical protein, putative [Bodo saltans]|uniref:GPI-anchored surface protein n=1 Tax=Bodo saltans TaxID=75058 RepID=A0A0S4JPE9_BODSA|nr:Hypothetical protein, putative [Bodo saltans]|eukprot:CUG93399.1 Hypothetical protein, putative [Bodo saltans]
MIRGFVRLLIRRLLQRIIEFTLRLFLLFGFRFDPVSACVHPRTARRTSETSASIRNQLAKPVGSDTPTMTLAADLSTPSEDFEVSRRVAALLSFFCLRLPLLLGGEPQSKSLLRHYISITDTKTAQFRKTKLPCGAIVFCVNLALNDDQKTPDAKRSGAVAFVGSPWDSVKELETLCLHIAVTTQRDVVLSIAHFSHERISVQDAVNSVLSKWIAASEFLSTPSLTIMASSYASSIALHAALRAPFQDGLPPIRGLLLVDPLVAVTMPQQAATKKPLPAVPGEIPAADTLALDAGTMKQLLVDSAIRACRCEPAAVSLAQNEINSSHLLDWFPPPLDDTFCVPLLLVYDPDGIWTQEMIAYFSKWTGCNGLVEGITYRTPSMFSSTFMRKEKTPSPVSDASATPSSTDLSPTLDIVCSHLTLWLSDVSSSIDDDTCSSRPLSACSTPWANSSRGRPFHDPHQKTSVDSMEGVFSRFPAPSSIVQQRKMQPQPHYAPTTDDVSNQQPRNSHFGIGGILRNISALPRQLDLTPLFGYKSALETTVEGESMQHQQQHILMGTPPLWKPQLGENLPRVASSGLHLDSLDCHPALKGIPNVFSRSLASDDALLGSGGGESTPLSH